MIPEESIHGLQTKIKAAAAIYYVLAGNKWVGIGKQGETVVYAGQSISAQWLEELS